MASIQTRPRASGTAYRVLFRVDGRLRSETFYEPRAAAQFKALVERIGPEAAMAIRAARVGAAPPDALTLRQWFDQHLTRATDITPGTVAEYRRVADRTWMPLLGDLPLERISRDDIARWVTWQQTQATRRNRPPAPKTVRNAHALLSTVLAAAVDDDRIPTNVAKGAAPPRGERTAMVFLTQSEFATFLDFIPPVEQPVVLMLAGTGMRWGELTALCWADVDLDADVPVVHIHRAWKRAEQGRELGAPKTRRSLRTIGLPRQLVDMLRPLRGPADDLLFHARLGGPLRHQAWHSRVWVPAVARANDPGRLGVPWLAPVLGKRPRVHDLRHSHASWLLAAGVPVNVVQQRLGHESAQTTLDVYAHVMPDALSLGARAAAAALVQALPEIEG